MRESINFTNVSITHSTNVLKCNPIEFDEGISSALHSKIFCHKTHDILFEEGTLCKFLIEILKGKVKVGFHDSYGNECVIAFCGKGDVLGQTNLLGNTHHDTFAIVVEQDTQVIHISMDNAKKMFLENPSYNQKINEHISKYLIQLRRSIEILFCNDIQSRLFQFIKNLAINHGEQKERGIYVSHNLTQSDIAASIGSSRKTTSLLLNQLQVLGAIDYSRNHFFIPNNSICLKP